MPQVIRAIRDSGWFLIQKINEGIKDNHRHKGLVKLAIQLEVQPDSVAIPVRELSEMKSLCWLRFLHSYRGFASIGGLFDKFFQEPFLTTSNNMVEIQPDYYCTSLLINAIFDPALRGQFRDRALE